MFLPFTLDLEHDLYHTKATWMRLSAVLRGSRYATVDDANRQRARLKARFRRDLWTTGAGELRLNFEAEWRKNRRVYVSRIAGEEFTVDVGDQEISLRDRFNNATWSGGVYAEYETTGKTAIKAEAEFFRIDYDEDYDAIEEVEPIDNNVTRWRLHLTRPTGWGRVKAVWETKSREYHDYAAVAEDGSFLPDVNRSYWYHKLSLDVSYNIAGQWRVTAEGHYRIRRDRHVGYYDYDEWSAGPEIEGPITDRLRLAASYDYYARDYPRAHVYRDAERPLRHDQTHRIDAEAVYELNRLVEVFIGAHSIQHAERNSYFSYDRLQTWLGFRFSEGFR